MEIIKSGYILNEENFIDSDICQQCGLSYGEHFNSKRAWKYKHIFIKETDFTINRNSFESNQTQISNKMYNIRLSHQEIVEILDMLEDNDVVLLWFEDRLKQAQNCQ